MDFLSVIYALAFYFATAVLVFGLAYKIRQYWRTPAPLKIPTTPAPITRTGVVLRMAREVTLFESLFKSNKWIWLFGWMFHVGLALVLLRHLRYFQQPVWEWVTFIQPFGKYAALAMLAGLAGLWARRFLVDRVRYISAPSDHLMLALLMGIGATGALMSLGGVSTDIVQVKAFCLGLLRFNIQPLPGDPLLLIHLGLVATLMIIFPFSKLLHAPGVFFSPSRNQVDNPREQRHVADWALRLERGSQQQS
jgi:nitrate reductase gamma subunit